MTEKIIGYLLLIGGVAIILISAVNGFGIFTHQVTPITLFNLPPISLDMSQVVSGALPPELHSLLSRQTPTKTEIFPAEGINLMLNLTAHLLLLGFFVTVGHKLASLGVSLLRPIKVKLRTTADTPQE